MEEDIEKRVAELSGRVQKIEEQLQWMKQTCGTCGDYLPGSCKSDRQQPIWFNRRACPAWKPAGGR